MILTAHATKVNKSEPNWTEPQTRLACHNHALSSASRLRVSWWKVLLELDCLWVNVKCWKAQEYDKLVLIVLCVTEFISYGAWSCDEGKISVSDEISFENRKQREDWARRNFDMNFNLEGCSRSGFHRLLRQLLQEGRADIQLHFITHNAASWVTHSNWHQISSRIEYLMPTNNIVVLIWHFNLTTKI